MFCIKSTITFSSCCHAPVNMSVGVVVVAEINVLWKFLGHNRAQSVINYLICCYEICRRSSPRYIEAGSLLCRSQSLSCFKSGEADGKEHLDCISFSVCIALPHQSLQHSISLLHVCAYINVMLGSDFVIKFSLRLTVFLLSIKEASTLSAFYCSTVSSV